MSLLLNLRFAKSKDYVFIAFSGHGYHVKGRDVDQTKICLAGKDEVFVSQLNCGAPKMTLVIDSCRQVFHTDEMFEDSYAADSLSKSMRFMDRKAHRDLYDQEVELAPRGIEILYSCDFDESAGESTSGGYFTQGLIRSAGYNNNRNGVLSVEKAFEMAKHYVKIKSIQQNPVFEGGRRIKHFPFAVSL